MLPKFTAWFFKSEDFLCSRWNGTSRLQTPSYLQYKNQKETVQCDRCGVKNVKFWKRRITYYSKYTTHVNECSLLVVDKELQVQVQMFKRDRCKWLLNMGGTAEFRWESLEDPRKSPKRSSQSPVKICEIGPRSATNPHKSR